MSDIDPDIGIHSIQNNQCSYYNITGFNTDITIKNHISILAVNIRSLNKNFVVYLGFLNIHILCAGASHLHVSFSITPEN